MRPGYLESLAVLAVLLFPLSFILSRIESAFPQNHHSRASLRPQNSLNVITLIYSKPADHINIAHNCRVISRTSHKLFVHTDNISQPYCGLCQCILFKQFDCLCPAGENGCPKMNPCQKVRFLMQSLKQYGEFLFLDSDLIIMKPDFLNRMQRRSQTDDFLATYGHLHVNKSRCSHSYHRDFNTGLMFMRRLPDVDYDSIITLMYKERKANHDQRVISAFIQKNYNNWDTLSFKWHCRSLKLYNQDIPLEDCYTIHDRRESTLILKKLRRRRLNVSWPLRN